MQVSLARSGLPWLTPMPSEHTSAQLPGPTSPRSRYNGSTYSLCRCSVDSFYVKDATLVLRDLRVLFSPARGFGGCAYGARSRTRIT